jgi:ketosteroid isomerase-like protein
MPSENLDMVRSIYLGWERGDFNSAAWADPDIEYLVVDGPEPGRRNGLAGMAEGWRDWLRAWEDFRAEPEKYIDLGDERILVLVRNSGRGRVSGLELDQRSGANPVRAPRRHGGQAGHLPGTRSRLRRPRPHTGD